jgi:glycosyltransferase involved in cell wall biosynthesis
MEYRPFYLAREWIKLGHKVSIVAASFSHLRNTCPHFTGNITEEVIEGIGYIWIRTPGYQGNGLGRVINIFSFIKGLYSVDKHVTGFEPDIVIASSTYPFDIYPARHIQKKYKSMLVYEVHDLWPLTLIELGGMNKRHPFIVFMQQAENYAYRNADRVVSILPKAIEYMQNHGMISEKFIHIPNGISKEEWENNNNAVPHQHEEILSRSKHEGRFIIGYAGSHGVTDTLDSLVDAALLLKDEPVMFAFVGRGPEKERLQERASKLGLGNVRFLPPVPKLSMPRLLDMMDALYIGCERKAIYRFGINPNKLFDYMMSGKPVIQAVEAGNDYVAESGCGVSVPPDDPRAIAEAALKLQKMTSAERKEIGLKGREYVIAHHDYSVLAKRFLQAFSL